MYHRIFSHAKKTFASFRYYNYRLYFVGYCVSTAGSWVQSVALSWISLQLTHSALQVGIVQALQFAPVLVAGPWGGLVADRYDNRRIVFKTQTLYALLAFAAGALIMLGAMTLPLLYAFSLLVGVIRVFDEPSRITLAPRLVPPELIKNAVSLNSTAYNVARIVGPAIGGVLIVTTNMAWCFYIDGLSFAAVLAALWLMRDDELYSAASAQKAKGQIVEGFRYILKTPLIRDMMLMLIIIGMMTYEFPTSLPAFVLAVLHGDAQVYASLFSAMGVGAVIGALFSAGHHHASARYLALVTFLFGVSITVASLMSSTWPVLIALGLSGFFSTTFLSLTGTMSQTECVPEMRGRVAAVRSMAMLGTTVVGAPIVGAIAEYCGGRYGLMASGISTIAAAGIFVYLRRGRCLWYYRCMTTYIPLESASGDHLPFSDSEKTLRALPITIAAFESSGAMSEALVHLQGLKGSEALRAIDSIAEQFAARVITSQTGLPEDIRNHATQAVTAKDHSGVAQESAEHFVMRELCAKVNRIKYALVERWLTAAPDTGLNEIARIEYELVPVAMAAVDRMYIRLATDASPLTSNERVEHGLTNECCVVRIVDGRPQEVPLNNAYPEEMAVVVATYKRVLERLEALKGTPDEAIKNRLDRKIAYYTALVRAHETYELADWNAVDALFTRQVVDAHDCIHVHSFETGYMTEAIVRSPEISLRAPDTAAQRVQIISTETKARMLEAMSDEAFAEVPSMDASRRLVSHSNTAARHFLGAGMETYDLKPVGQILPNDVPARALGGVDSSLDLTSMRERQGLINKAFIATYGESAFVAIYEPVINAEEDLGGLISSHEFGHAIGVLDDTQERLGRVLAWTYVEEWKATAGGLVFNRWIPFLRGVDGITLDTLRKDLISELAEAARYAAMRDHDTAKCYYRHSMLFVKVAEECGVVTKGSGEGREGDDEKYPWKITLTDENIKAFYAMVTEQYKALLHIYASGTQSDLKAFLRENLTSTPFIEYMATAVDTLSPDQTMPTPTQCAEVPEM